MSRLQAANRQEACAPQAPAQPPRPGPPPPGPPPGDPGGGHAGALHRLSIRVKLALFVGLVVVTVVLGQSFERLAGEALRAQTLVALRARLSLMSVAAGVGAAWTPTHVPDVEPYFHLLERRLDVRSLALLDRDGQLVAFHGERPGSDEIARVTRLGVSTAPRSLWTAASGPLEMVVASPIQQGDRSRGWLFCAFRSDEPGERLQETLGVAIWSAVLWVLLGGGLALVVTGRFTAPLVRLASDLEHADLDGYRVPEGGPGEGEVGVVQVRLAATSERIREEQRRVAELNTALRHQVEVVTADIARVAAHRQAILDAVSDGIVELDRDGKVTIGNGPARELLGRGEEIAGRPVADLVDAPERLHRALSGAASLGRPVMLHLRTRAGGAGGQRQLRVRLAPLVERAAPGAAILVAEDITESQRLEEEMSRSERLASIGTLAAGLTHQIGNYLNAVSGYAALLARRIGKDAALQADVAVIQREVRAAAELMDKMRLLARTRPPSESEFLVGTVIREVLDLVRPQAAHQGVQVEDAVQQPSCKVRGDPVLLQQAFLNLMINSVQAMPGGGSLQVSSRCLPPVCVVDVADTGCGIPPEILPHVFDAFFTTKPEGQGTGLGLPIALRVVELHGGTIWLESRPGEGTTFHVELPTRPAAERSGSHPPPAEPRRAPAEGGA